MLFKHTAGKGYCINYHPDKQESLKSKSWVFIFIFLCHFFIFIIPSFGFTSQTKAVVKHLAIIHLCSSNIWKLKKKTFLSISGTLDYLNKPQPGWDSNPWSSSNETGSSNLNYTQLQRQSAWSHLTCLQSRFVFYWTNQTPWSFQQETKIRDRLTFLVETVKKYMSWREPVEHDAVSMEHASTLNSTVHWKQWLINVAPGKSPTWVPFDFPGLKHWNNTEMKVTFTLHL